MELHDFHFFQNRSTASCNENISPADEFNVENLDFSTLDTIDFSKLCHNKKSEYNANIAKSSSSEIGEFMDQFSVSNDWLYGN